MRSWFLLVLAACYAPTVQSNVPCSEDYHCPDGQSCQRVAGVRICVSGEAMPDAPVVVDAPADGEGIDSPVAIDAPTLIDASIMPDAKADASIMPDAMVDAKADAAPLPDAMVDAPIVVDTDGDGIPDSMDNCPLVANPGQENEDGDRFGDVCDPCPPIADNAPLDTDGDGVADACDPRPTIPGDKIVLFEGFHNGLPPGWVVGGAWSVAADSAVISAGSMAAALTISKTLVEPYAVSAGVTPTALVAGGSPEGFGTVIRYASGPAAGVECVAHVSTNNITMIDLTTGVTQGGIGPLSFVAGTSYVVTGGKTPVVGTSGGYNCAVTSNGSYTVNFTSFAPLNPRIGVRVNNMSVIVPWVMAVDASGP